MSEPTSVSHPTSRLRRRAWLLCWPLLGLALASCESEAPGSPGRGRALFGTCIPCHGPDGAGQRALGAPAIAGQNQWYIEAQLHKFQGGLRGAHPDDAAGLRMRPLSRILVRDGDVAAVAAYVASMPPVRPETTLTGDIEKGKAKYAVCAACHGADGQGIKVLSSPSLVLSSDWYKLAQLEKFRSGIRGTSKGDVYGAQMRAQAMALPDEQSLRDIIAYINTLSADAPER